MSANTTSTNDFFYCAGVSKQDFVHAWRHVSNELLKIALDAELYKERNMPGSMSLLVILTIVTKEYVINVLENPEEVQDGNK